MLSLFALPSRGADEAKKYPFVFVDAGEEAGLFPALEAIKGHGAAWGDIDGDGWLDLYVATFAAEGSKLNMLMRSNKGKFTLDDQKALNIATRGTGVVFADLDNDGDLDLYIGSMPKAPGKDGITSRGCSMFRNDGGGKFTDISQDNGACPAAFGGRSVALFDFDGDGLLDLLVGEEPIVKYNGSTTKSSRIFRNKGNLQFEDVSRAVGLPENIPWLGVSAADVNNDGWPDFFLCAPGANRLFLNDRKGKFVEAEGSAAIFDWKGLGAAGGDNMVCGVCFADVNRDGLLDVVLGQHFSRPWNEPVANRLYLNRGIKNGVPTFEDVTTKVGLSPLYMKAPHVEIQDFDNDGWPDISASLVKFHEGKPYPVIFRHQGIKDGLPQFRDDAWGVNDFPNAEDKAIKSTGTFFDTMIKSKKVIYSAPGPVGDYNNDGKLDIFMANWWMESRSLLLKNTTPGGNWLKVQVEGAKDVNRMGVGSRVKIYTAGKIGDPAGLIGCRDIAVGFGYASGQSAVTHFGLGKEETVDVEVILPHGKGTIAKKGVKANEALTIKQ